MTAYIHAGAVLSKDGVHRYSLTREWFMLSEVSLRRGFCCFIMLNPSTADHREDDPTLRKCVGFASRWGFSKLEIVNLFAYRCTNPEELFLNDAVLGSQLSFNHLVGPDNLDYIKSAVARAELVVAAWGNYGGYNNQDKKVVASLPQHYQLHCLGLTKHRQPLHPLHPSYRTVLQYYNGRA